MTATERVQHINDFHSLEGVEVVGIPGVDFPGRYRYVCKSCGDMHGIWTDAADHQYNAHGTNKYYVSTDREQNKAFTEYYERTGQVTRSASSTNENQEKNVSTQDLKNFLDAQLGWNLDAFKARYPALYQQFVSGDGNVQREEIVVTAVIGRLQEHRDAVDAAYATKLAELETELGRNEDRAQALIDYYTQVSALVANGHAKIDNTGAIFYDEAYVGDKPVYPKFRDIGRIRNDIKSHAERRDDWLKEIDTKINYYNSVNDGIVSLTTDEFDSLVTPVTPL